MAITIRKKSPRAPSMPLNEALDRAMAVYEKERLHPSPIDVVANAIGYKNASNGAALSALASLRYYGLLERPKEGFLSVSKDVQSFCYAPSEEKRKQLLIQFLKTPPLFADLLAKYEGGLPSEATMRYDLIERGFLPASANAALSAFKHSIEFAGYFDAQNEVSSEQSYSSDEVPPPPAAEAQSSSLSPVESAPVTSNSPPALNEDGSMDRIPVRLSGGRRAWLVVPTPFFSADKARLKAQIDLLLTDDESEMP